VAFDLASFRVRYPEFAGVSDPLLGAYAQESTLYLDATGAVVSDPTASTLLTNMVVAHLAQLYSGSSTTPASSLVGRIASATEGSVSVSADYGTQAPSASYVPGPQYQGSLPWGYPGYPGAGPW